MPVDALPRHPRSRWLLPAVVLGLLAALLAPVPAAMAATGVRLVGFGSGRCLDVANNNQKSGGRVIVYDCHGGDNQAWTLTPAGELRVFAGALCLDVKVQDRTSPATVETYRCNGGANQRWTLHSDGTITGVQSGLCLDVKGRATANGSVVELYTCNGGSNQRWTLGPRDTQAPTVPGNPRATNLTCNSVTFAWNASTDNVAVTHYDVYHDG